MKWLKLLLNKEFRTAVIDLYNAVGDAQEDGKLTAAEQSTMLKAMWRLVRALRG